MESDKQQRKIKTSEKSMRIDANQCSAMTTVKRQRQSMKSKDPSAKQKQNEKNEIENGDHTKYD